MIEQKKDAPGNKPYWVCTNCKWPFISLQEANNHNCNTKNISNYSFKSYSKNEI